MIAQVEILHWLTQHGVTLLLGSTCVLGAGCLSMLLHRGPARRRQLGITTATAVVLYLCVAPWPLPRWQSFAATPNADLDPATPSATAEAELAVTSAVAPLAAPTEPWPAPGTTATDVATAAQGPTPLLPGEAALSDVPKARSAAPPVRTARSGPAPAWLTDAPWPLVPAFLFLLGAALVLLRHGMGLARLHALLATCSPVPPTRLERISLPRGTRVLSTPRPIRPFCAGLWRPFVVLPADLLAAHRHAEAQAVLRHEAAHLRAGDCRWQAMLALLAAALFWHPLFWWLRREVRFCSELLADDAAAEAEGRHDYARALLDLAERDQPELISAGSVSVFHHPSEFYRRISMLLQRQGSLSTSTSRLRRLTQTAAALGLVAASAAVFGVPVAAQDPEARTVRQQNVELRQTIELLRTELREMRAQVEQLRDNDTAGRIAGEPPTGTGAPSAVSKDERIRELLAAQGYGSADTTGRLGTLTNDAHARERLAEILGRIHSTCASGAPPEPDADAIPGLSNLLLLGSLRTSQAQEPVAGSVEASPKSRTYRVQTGDSLARIAAKQLGNAALADQLAELNGIDNPNAMAPGMQLRLPVQTDPTQTALPRPVPGMTSGNVTTAPAPAAGSTSFAPSTSTPLGATADLVTRCLDLQAELEVAELTAAETTSLAEAGQATAREARQAAINLRTLHKKLVVVQRMIDGELAATEIELTWLAQRQQDSSPTERLELDMQTNRARCRLEALRSTK